MSTSESAGVAREALRIEEREDAALAEVVDDVRHAVRPLTVGPAEIRDHRQLDPKPHNVDPLGQSPDHVAVDVAKVGLGVYGFTLGEVGYEARQVSSGVYEGQVLWKGGGTVPQWRANRIFIQGDDYSDVGSDNCSRNMRRVR